MLTHRLLCPWVSPMSLQFSDLRPPPSLFCLRTSSNLLDLFSRTFSSSLFFRSFPSCRPHSENLSDLRPLTASGSAASNVLGFFFNGFFFNGFFVNGFFVNGFFVNGFFFNGFFVNGFFVNGFFGRFLMPGELVVFFFFWCWPCLLCLLSVCFLSWPPAAGLFFGGFLCGFFCVAWAAGFFCLTGGLFLLPWPLGGCFSSEPLFHRLISTDRLAKNSRHLYKEWTVTVVDLFWLSSLLMRIWNIRGG